MVMLCACGRNAGTGSEGQNTAGSQSGAQTPENSPAGSTSGTEAAQQASGEEKDASGQTGEAAASAPVSETVVSSGSNGAVFSGLDFKSMDARTFTKYMGNGINLGNTMEAFGRPALGTGSPVSSYETYWGEPVTTAQMVQGMKDCGFDSIRIPVSWTNMMNYESGDYTINAAYLDRVEEIVNYALNAEMFVVVNDHWDGGWWARFGSATQKTVDDAFAMYESMWRQIAERFKDYSRMLVLESANEELGDALNDNSDWADSGHLKADECYDLTNRINQLFVDTVRSTGGNNTDRFLLIAGYNTDIAKTCDDRFKMPSDSAASKLILSVHYYTPWNYCGVNNQARWGLKSEYEDMNSLLKKMTKYTDKGYGLIIGEYGALPVYDSDTQTHEAKENTVEYTTNFLDNCDIYGFCPMLWSCNDFFKRVQGVMLTDELAELFLSRRYEAEAASGDSYISDAQARMAASLEAAPEMWDDVETYEAGTPVAWIMWNGGAGTYSVGDKFNPADNTAGITANNAIVDGAGEYTVSLDFAGGNDGLTFAALAIADCELLWPNSVILLQSVTLDGVEATLTATPYTSSDDGKCTRVNLYNEWVAELPGDARSLGGLNTASPMILDKTELVGIHNITINFRLVVR